MTLVRRSLLAGLLGLVGLHGAWRWRPFGPGWRALGPPPPEPGWFPHADGVYVIRDAEHGIGVLERLCPHQGCPVQKRAEDLWCPCHGSRFGADGRLQQGPAHRDLVWFEVRLRAGQLEYRPGGAHRNARWIHS